MAGDDTEKIPAPDPDATFRLLDAQLGGELAAGRSVFGRYRLEAEIGRGGMGVVWRAVDETLGETVALKFLSSAVARDPVAVDELKEETRKARRLRHAHIVSVFDFVQEGELVAVSMEFINGTTLAQLRLKQPGKVFSPEALAPLLPQICAALDYAHNEAKVAHRDLKPANVLVTGEGRAKLADFGIARSLSETQTRRTGPTGGASGTLLYMSPQQLRGQRAAAADDVYALGATLYELLGGKPPFYTGELTHQILNETAEPLNERRAALAPEAPALPRAWVEVIGACLAKDPERRPRSAGELLRWIEDEEGWEKTVAMTPEQAAALAVKLEAERQAAEAAKTVAPMPEKPEVAARGRRRWLWPVAAVLAAGMAAAGWYFGSVVPEARRAEEAARAEAEQRRTAAEARRAREQAAAAAHTEALGRVAALPLTAGDAELAAADGLVEAYGKAATLMRFAEVKSALAKQRGLVLAERERLRLDRARGGVVVTTTPAGAEVAVGALALEKSPVTLKDVRLGKYPVVVQLAGYEDLRREVEVKENEFAMLDVALVRSTGTLQVASVPAGVEVEVKSGKDGARIVKAPVKLEAMPTGDYELVFRRPGWPEQRQGVTVKRNETVGALGDFIGGRMEITSVPDGAEVFLAGRSLGLTPLKFEDLVPGTRELEFRLKGHKAVKVTLEVRAKETALWQQELEKVREPEAGAN